MSAENWAMGAVMIRTQPAGRDVDKHAASLSPREPQTSRTAGGKVVPALTARKLLIPVREKTAALTAVYIFKNTGDTLIPTRDCL